MKTTLSVSMFAAALAVVGFVSTASASESKIKMSATQEREVANQTGEQSSSTQVQEVERPESLKTESTKSKRHTEYNKLIDRHYDR